MLAVVAVAIVACALAGWVPLGFSIVTVFLLAGPHNWMEARYFMARMPARWGPLQRYYLTGIFGVLVLTAGFVAIPALATALRWDQEHWLVGLALWNTSLVAWIAALAWMRSRQNPRRNWNGIFPLAMGLVALAWLWPQAWGLGLVYLHPLVALLFLDREIGIRKPEWRATYRRCLALVPALVGMLWWQLADSPSLPGRDVLTEQITAHAGASLLSGVSSHLLVATHTFLEMLHYGVWLVAIPLLTLRIEVLEHRNRCLLAAVDRLAAIAYGRDDARGAGSGVVALERVSGKLSAHEKRLFHRRDAACLGGSAVPAPLAIIVEPPNMPNKADYYWSFLAIGYLASVAIETQVLLIGLSRRHPFSDRLLAGLWLTACTYPIVSLVLPLVMPQEPRWLHLVRRRDVSAPRGGMRPVLACLRQNG